MLQSPSFGVEQSHEQSPSWMRKSSEYLHQARLAIALCLSMMATSKGAEPPTREALIKQLNASKFAEREDAERILIELVRKDIENDGIPYRDKNAFSLEKPVSREQEVRLERIRETIEQLEYSVDLRTPSVFHAPKEWNEPDHTLNITETLRTIAAETNQPLSVKNTPLSILGERILTKPLNGMRLWEALDAVRTPEQSIQVNANSSGELFIHGNAFRGFEERSMSGAMCATLHVSETNTKSASIFFQTEPKFVPVGWKADSVKMLLEDGSVVRPSIDANVGEKDSSMSIDLPCAEREGERAAIIVECTLSAMPIQTFKVKDLTRFSRHTIDSFGGKESSIRYSSYEEDDHQYWIICGIDPPELPTIMKQNIGVTSIGVDGLTQNLRTEEEPNSVNGGRWVFSALLEPQEIHLHAPRNIVASASAMFVFPNVPLPQKSK